MSHFFVPLVYLTKKSKVLLRDKKLKSPKKTINGTLTLISIQIFYFYRNLPGEISYKAWKYVDRFLADEKGDHAILVDRANYKCYKDSHRGKYSDLDKAFRITDDDLVSGLNSWYIFMYSVVHKSLNKFLLECLQHGIINHFKTLYRDSRNAPARESAKVLTMYILSAGFYVWLTSIGVACVVFVLEHIHKRVIQLQESASQFFHEIIKGFSLKL